jgi:uncharacterized protein (DUF488 family)
VIYTIGHSTRPAEEFLRLLTLHGIGQLADVRTVPKSRRHPHFAREALDPFLTRHGIAYRHFPALGGLRKPRTESVNTAWTHPGFRGYADYMQTDEFARGVDELLEFSQDGDARSRGATVVMCAEAKWWQCHRRLLSDALLVRGVPVRHIVSPAEARPHELTEFARMGHGKVIYPGLL